jgi:hypothetical protein
LKITRMRRISRKKLGQNTPNASPSHGGDYENSSDFSAIHIPTRVMARSMIGPVSHQFDLLTVAAKVRKLKTDLEENNNVLLCILHP